MPLTFELVITSRFSHYTQIWPRARWVTSHWFFGPATCCSLLRHIVAKKTQHTAGRRLKKKPVSVWTQLNAGNEWSTLLSISTHVTGGQANQLWGFARCEFDTQETRWSIGDWLINTASTALNMDCRLSIFHRMFLWHLPAGLTLLSWQLNMY